MDFTRIHLLHICGILGLRIYFHCKIFFLYQQNFVALCSLRCIISSYLERLVCVALASEQLSHLLLPTNIEAHKNSSLH